MPFVAGNDIDAHCPKCGKDTHHTVMVVHGGLVHEVRCTECRDVHTYKRPHKPKKPSKAAASAKRTRKKPRKKAAKTEQSSTMEWHERVFGVDQESARPYSIKETFAANDFVVHSKFGLGVVTQLYEDGKLDILFKEGLKKLVHGRS